MSDALGRPLPTEDDEARDPNDADRRYDEVVSALRHRTIGRERFPLVFEENCEYGFRRNSLGLKNMARAVTIISLIASAVLIGIDDGSLASRGSRWGLSAGVGLAMLAYWSVIVNESWVRRAAETYADRLFEALESLNL